MGITGLDDKNPGKKPGPLGVGKDEPYEPVKGIHPKTAIDYAPKEPEAIKPENIKEKKNKPRHK